MFSIIYALRSNTKAFKSDNYKTSIIVALYC